MSPILIYLLRATHKATNLLRAILFSGWIWGERLRKRDRDRMCVLGFVSRIRERPLTGSL